MCCTGASSASRCRSGISWPATPTSGPASIITSAHTEEYLDPAAVLAMLDAHKAGEADHSRRIWTILVFQIWHEIFVTGAITPDDPGAGVPGAALSRADGAGSLTATLRARARSDAGGAQAISAAARRGVCMSAAASSP